MATFLTFAAFATPESLAAVHEIEGRDLRQVALVEPEFLSFGIDASQVTERNSGIPFDFTRERLLNLTAPLSPAFIRYSGTKIETTFYDDTNSLGPKDAPEGYEFILSRDEWLEANEFARQAGFKVMASTSAGPGPRNPDGSWDPTNAESMFGRALSAGYELPTVQLGNEPNLTYYGSGLPPEYDADDYAADVVAFKALRDQLTPDSLFVGPGPFFTGGAERPLLGARFGPDVSEIMERSGAQWDIISYHQYPAFGDLPKCEFMTPKLPADTLSRDFLDIPSGAYEYMTSLRDAHAPGKPIWIDESGNTACGGASGYSDNFISSFYYLSSLGYLASKGVGSTSRWTLSGPQPYAMIRDADLSPGPDYWAALLWKKLMGPVVLEPRVDLAGDGVRIYSHCLPSGGTAGGLTSLALNTSRGSSATVTLRGQGATGASMFLVTGDLNDRKVSLGGTELEPDENGNPPALEGQALADGTAEIPPASYAFIVQPNADAEDCGGTPEVTPGKKTIRVASRAIRKRVARSGRIPVRCRANFTGTCEVTVRKGGRKIGSGRTRVAQGRTKTFKIRLGKRVVKRLRKNPKPRRPLLSLLATGKDADGSVVARHTVRIRLR